MVRPRVGFTGSKGRACVAVPLLSPLLSLQVELIQILASPLCQRPAPLPQQHRAAMLLIFSNLIVERGPLLEVFICISLMRKTNFSYI